MERKISSPSLFLRFHSANLFFFSEVHLLGNKRKLLPQDVQILVFFGKICIKLFKKLLVKNALRLHCEVFHSVRNKIFWTKSWKFLEFFMFLLFFFLVSCFATFDLIFQLIQTLLILFSSELWVSVFGS